MALHEPLEWCWAMDKETQTQKAERRRKTRRKTWHGTAEALYSNLLLTVLRVGSYITVCSYLHRLDYLFMPTKRGMMTAARVGCPVALVLSGERGCQSVRLVGKGRIRPFPGHAQPACIPLHQHDANYTSTLANFFYQSLSEEVV